jgi:endonuclease YncB( thermonuclease family)
MSRSTWIPLAAFLLAGGALLWRASPALLPGARAEEPVRLAVPREGLFFDDGDSIVIRWKEAPEETVRLLGIDTPETVHLDHDIPYPQPFGNEAAGFLAGAIAVADRIELVRATGKDPYGRTLGYVFVNGRNLSVLLVEARLAVETVSRYGDNGLPTLAAEVVAASKAAGPVAFEDPHLYRKRMRIVSTWLKKQGLYPKGPEAPPAKEARPK